MAGKNFLTWGHHAVLAALTDAPTSVLELWLKEGPLSVDLARIETLSDTLGVTAQVVSLKTLARLSDGAVHQGVVLRRRMPEPLEFDNYLTKATTHATVPLLLVLDQIQDPQNFGACLRVADGAGVDAVLIPRDHSAPISGTVAKAASGALDSVPIITVANLARALDGLRGAGIWLVGAAHDGPITVYACDMTLPTALIVGSEAQGLRQLTRKKCDRLASIPMQGAVGSLNVSTATAIALFEARRQRM
ncbi:MAG: 23S rRNA (guanosine(2251)-2'-O)-methyltransferase RlmB [Proteobacteria bacterium]|nr:23S rRNA (guanosine(2251)-2'-O)-methyltransferase RlmB [Pseudomonadota bacterium]